MDEALLQVQRWKEINNTSWVLDLSNLDLTELPPLPNDLEQFNCFNNQLTTLPVLPPNLWLLVCYNNQLTTLPALPLSLGELYCSDNQLMTLPEMPPKLRWLDCNHNQLTMLPSLPPNLVWFNCCNNPLPFFKKENWKRLQHLRLSIYLRSFQRHCRRRLIERKRWQKAEINYAVHGRPGLGLGWFEFCLEPDIDALDYDHRKYNLRAIC